MIQNYKKNNKVLNNQLSEFTEYIEYLEKLVTDYKSYIEQRFNDINDQKFKVVEGFGTKNNNDLLVYIITCVFVLLLVDYIFKIGKQSI